MSFGVPPSIPEKDIVDVLATDILVIGGISGLVATVSAAEEASVLLRLKKETLHSSMVGGMELLVLSFMRREVSILTRTMSGLCFKGRVCLGLNPGSLGCGLIIAEK